MDFSDSDRVFFCFSRFAALASFLAWSLDFIESLDVAGGVVWAIALAVVAANAAAMIIASSFFMEVSSGGGVLDAQNSIDERACCCI
jgi:hypothetical protein